MRFPLVHIIIVNWNGWRDTLDCIETCRKLTWPNYSIVVVDNASSDGSEENLRRHLEEMDIIQSGANLGFGGGCNIGIRQALERGADYVWLLNNDAVADPQALTILVEAMENDKAVGIAGSKIYYHNEPERSGLPVACGRKGEYGCGNVGLISWTLGSSMRCAGWALFRAAACWSALPRFGRSD